MSSNEIVPQSFKAPLVVPLKSSRILLFLISLTHAGAAACVWLADIYVAASILLCTVTICSGIYLLLRYALLWLDSSIIEFVYSNNTFKLVFNIGQPLAYELHASTVCGRYLSILRFTPLMESSALISLPIASDMLSDDDYRRLRARVKLLS